jgi:hypothetical protein
MVRDAVGARRIVAEFDYEASANISLPRCKVVSDFLAHPARPDWLWMIDADMTFAADILDRLLASADIIDRPIVGGLCFGVRPVEPFNETSGSTLELFPTIYTLNDDGRLEHHLDYPRDALVRVSSTGAACLLVHRRVVADSRWFTDGHPMPWFRESVLESGGVISEDHFFCLRAGSFGYPVHLNTAARTGHVKTFIADEAMYLAQRPTANDV